MNSERRSGVLLVSVFPQAHAMLLQALRSRGISVAIARSGRLALRKLRLNPVVVLVDLVYGPALDPESIAQLNAVRSSATVLGLHDGDLGKFADELDELVMDGFFRASDWFPVIELAAESLHQVTEARRN
ncbi:MAG: hypothetical protein ACRENS_01985 [Candidatus Eiseniibacteriota bacterium]